MEELEWSYFPMGTDPGRNLLLGIRSREDWLDRALRPGPARGAHNENHKFLRCLFMYQ